MEQEIKKEFVARYLLIHASGLLDRFMQAADFFEKGKVLGRPQIIFLKFEVGDKDAMCRAEQAIDVLRAAHESVGQLVSLVHLVSVQQANVITLNNSVLPYINKEVRMFSTGDKWGFIDELLRSFKIDVTTDEHRFVTDMKMPVCS